MADAEALRRMREMFSRWIRDCFEKQRGPDRTPWPGRYPNQSPPKLNIAGVIKDLDRKRYWSSHRMEDRPVLVDTGRLKNSFTPEAFQIVNGPNPHLRLNITVPYTMRVHDGGPSITKMTPAFAQNLYRIMVTPKQAARAGVKRTREKKAPFMPYLRVLMGMWRKGRREWQTNIVARPFLDFGYYRSADVEWAQVSYERRRP